MAHLNRYCKDESASQTKSFKCVKKFLEFRKDRCEPLYELDSNSVLIPPRTTGRPSWMNTRARSNFLNQRALFQNRKPRPPPSSPSRAFREFANTAGLSFFKTMDLRIILAESRDWEKYNQFPRRQAGRIPVPVLGKRVPNFGL